jgi:hypothetical protein
LTTSNNTSWELTRDDIVAAALRKLGVLYEGQTPNAEQISTAAQALNSLISLFQTKGMPLWKRVTQVVTPVLSQQAYTITNAVKVAQVVLKYLNNSTQYELIRKVEYDFNQLPQGTVNAGIAVHYYFQPGIEDGTLNLWPVPDASMVSQCQVLVIKQKEFDGFFAAGETPDFPPYYSDALIYSLAVRLAPEYGLSLQDRTALKAEAKEYTDDAFNYGDDDGSIYLQPNNRMTNY